MTLKFKIGLVYNLIVSCCIFVPVQLFFTGHWVIGILLSIPLSIILLIASIEIGSLLEKAYITKEN